MKNNWFKRSISLILAMVLLLQCAPLQIWAAETSATVAEVSSETTDSAASVQQIVGEEVSLREEGVKHFRLSDGSYIAVSYGMPVHYKDSNGDWQDIDNRPIMATAGEDDVYQISNAGLSTSFSSTLTNGDVLTSSYGNASVKMSLLDTEQALTLTGTPQMDTELDSETTIEAETAPTVPEETAPPETEASATEPEAEAGSNIETVSPSESEIDNTLPPETEPPSIVPPETEANVAPVAPAETEPEPTTEAVVDNVAETEPEEATEAVVDDTNENETEPVADSATTPEMEPETATEAEAETEPETEPTVQPDAEIIGIEIPTEELLVFSRSSAASLVVNAPVTMTTNEDSSWRAEDLIPEHLKSSILYENVFPGIDLLYTAYGYDVKEQIIVREKQNSYRYDFLLELDGLTAVLNEDGSVSLVDAQQNVVYNIPVPYMEDADHNISYDVFYSLEEVAGGVVLTIEADADWINEEGRAFPVAIDPTLELVTNAYSNKIYAGFVAAGSPDKSYKGDDYIYTGFGAAAENQEFQAFLYFNNIPDVPDGYTLVETNLYIATLDYSAQGQCFELPLGLYGISSGGPSSGANIDNWLLQLTWNTKPIVNKANTIDYVTLSGATNGNYVSWDMTELCEAWYADSNISRVAALCIPDGVNCSSNYCASPRFYSPQNANSAVIFVVSYRDITGIEPYYTYSTFDVGLAGTAYISDVTGQSKVVKEVATYASTVNPFSLNLVYNSDYFSDNSTIDYQPPTKIDLSMKLGSGWTLDIIQRVVAETISGTSYLRYHDGDGTIHYFVKNGNEYCDEDGLGLKIVDSGNNVYTMSDNQDNKWIFTNSYLTEIQDNNGNKYKINYSDKKIETIVQTNNNGTAITVASFSYDSNKYLTTITDSAGDAYHLGYSGDNLISVTRNTNTVANYSYSGHQLTKITDTLPNYSLELSYANGKVSSYKELGGDGTGAQCDITYPNNSKTTYHDYGVNRVKGDTDDILTHYLFDYAGRTVNAYTTDINGKVLGATNAVYTGSNSTDKKNNRVQRTASVGVTSQQLLQDFGFEVGTSGTSWAFSDVSNIDAQVGINSEKPRTGTNSLHVRIGSGVTNEVSSSHVTKALKAGTTYTLSAYFNTSGVTAFDGRGLCLLVTKSGNTVAKSNYLNYKTSAAVDNGWIRWSVTFTAAADGVHALGIFCHGTEGHIYVDDLQLEDGNAPSNHNLLENGNMSSSSYGWTLGAGCSYDTQRMKITGSPASINTYAYQDVPINLPSDETYVLSGWVTANAVPDNITNGDADSDTNKQCGLRAVIYYSDNSTENHYVPFNADLTEKQFVSTAIVPKQPDKKVNKIRVVCAYEKNANVAYFDDISLVREAAQTMKYDDDGNLISVISTGQGSENSTYDDNNNLTKLVTNGAGTYTYSYDDSNYKHRPTSVTNGLITQSMTYDGAGNVATSTLKSTDTTFTKTLNSSSEYTNSGNLLSSITDSNDSTTNYTYTSARNKKAGIANTTSVVVKDENNEDVEKIVGRQVTDEFGRLRQAFFINTVEDSSGETLENETELEYIFSKFRLHQIERFDGSDREYYNFAYDDFSNVTQITIGDKHGDSNNIKLVEYEYGANNGPLVKQTYGNTDSVSYTYDNLGRVKTATYSDGRELTYTYTGDGLLHSIKDGKLNVTYLYVYDTIGRLINSSKTNSSGILLLTQQEYNASNQLAGQSWQMGDTSYSESYTYNAADGSLNTMTTATGQTVNFGYDKLRRLLWVSNGLYTYSYTYRDISDTQTTTQVQSLWYNGIAGGLGIHYTYDDLGNIKSYADYNGTWNYTYDDLNQLTQATIGNNTYTYTYDGFGNITSANGHTYAYENTYWDDLLTAYDGETITYDGSGNPTSYYNGTRWTFGWEEGRNLVSAAATGKQIFYAYDHEGIRTSKTVNGTTHNYVYASGKLLRETYGENVLDFFYDANGRPFALKYNGTVYYYILNVQGDILRMVDADGTVVANYRYDPYGNILAATGDLAEINPLRYRGYYYDSDSGLCYVSSRYYDPEIGRFINADAVDLLGANGDFASYNLFAYCGNNPADRKDSSGNAWETVFDIISLGSSIIEVASNPYDVGAWVALAGDIIDVAVPFVAGVGETVRVVNTGRKIADAADDMNDARRVASKIHGNSLSSNKINYGYQLIDKNNNVVKYGESKNPLTRYSQKWLDKKGYKVQIKVAGTKRGVHEWQHDMIENYAIISGGRPELNKSMW